MKSRLTSGKIRPILLVIGTNTGGCLVVNLSPTKKGVSRMTDEKMFTQDELDQVLKERLARQKKAHDEEIKETADALKATQAELVSLRKAENDAALAEIELLKLQVDPAVVELLPDELSSPAQLTWLRKAAGQLPAQPRTKTPKTPIPQAGNKEFVPLPPARRLA